MQTGLRALLASRLLVTDVGRLARLASFKLCSVAELILFLPSVLILRDRFWEGWQLSSRGLLGLGHVRAFFEKETSEELWELSASFGRASNFGKRRG